MDNQEILKLFFKYVSRLLMLLLVMPMTNSARGLVAKWNGDDTSEREGRITLAPMSHLDPIGSLMIFLIGFGWSKPMPIQFTRMKNQRLGIITVSLAGPVSHFLASIVCKVIMRLALLIPFVSSQISSYAFTGKINPTVAFYIVIGLISDINVCLGVINCLPLPPMDGFVLLYQFAGRKFHSWYHANYQLINQVSTIILFALFFIDDLTAHRIDPLGWLINLVDGGLDILVSLPFMLVSLITG